MKLPSLPKLPPWQSWYLVPLLLLGAWIWGSCQKSAGRAEGRLEIERMKDRALADSNRAWLARWDSIRAEVEDAEAKAAAAAEQAVEIKGRREARPLPLPTATASDSAAYWKAEALDARAEAGKWETAYKDQLRATAKLKLAADTAAARLGRTTNRLDTSLDREANKKFGIAKPLTAIAGCLLGTLAVKDDLVGCLGGGLVLTVALPTR